MPPHGVSLTFLEARHMLNFLTSCFGVKPQALLLPRQPGSRVRLCQLDSLLGLIDVMIVELRSDISQHTEVRAEPHASPSTHILANESLPQTCHPLSCCLPSPALFSWSRFH